MTHGVGGSSHGTLVIRCRGGLVVTPRGASDKNNPLPLVVLTTGQRASCVPLAKRQDTLHNGRPLLIKPDGFSTSRPVLCNHYHYCLLQEIVNKK